MWTEADASSPCQLTSQRSAAVSSTGRGCDVRHAGKNLKALHDSEKWGQDHCHGWWHGKSLGRCSVCRTVVSGARNASTATREARFGAESEDKLCKEFPCCDVFLHVITNPLPETLSFRQCDLKLTSTTLLTQQGKKRHHQDLPGFVMPSHPWPSLPREQQGSLTGKRVLRSTTGTRPPTRLELQSPYPHTS